MADIIQETIEQHQLIEWLELILGWLPTFSERDQNGMCEHLTQM